MKLTHGRAAGLMVGVTLLWATAGVVTRQLEQVRSFELTFWRSFTLLSLLQAAGRQRRRDDLIAMLSIAESARRACARTRFDV